jgi:Transposase DDE domain
MGYHTATEQQALVPLPEREQVQQCLIESCQALVGPQSRRPRGKPATLGGLHLCLGMVLCGLEGFGAQLGLWRRLRVEVMGPFAPVPIGDQAVYTRLSRAAGLMAHFFEQVSGWMRAQLVDWQDRSLAPFATQVLALDESKLDVVGRWLPQLRELGAGDSGLLAGRLAAVFDVRLHQWVRVDLLAEAGANCKEHARELIAGLSAGVLLLFDRGYLSFAWFDELTARQIWWVSRYANRVSYQVRHVLSQGDGVLDAIVWLGANGADRAKYAVRLVQFYQHGKLHRYLTNVLDPQQLSLADLARLYARRWDIELAFRLLKD